MYPHNDSESKFLNNNKLCIVKGIKNSILISLTMSIKIIQQHTNPLDATYIMLPVIKVDFHSIFHLPKRDHV